MATSAIMKTKSQSGVVSSRSITNIDPNANNADIKDFVESLNDLTTQTLTDLNRVDTANIFNDKLPRNLTLSTPTVSAAAIPNDATEAVAVTLTGDGGFLYSDLTVKKISGAISIFLDLNNVQTADGRFPVIKLAKGHGKTSSFPGELEFSVPESGNYQSEAVTLTIGE